MKKVLNTNSISWRILEDSPASGSFNMAVDHTMAVCLGVGEGVLRLYGWEAPTVSFGRNEPARGHYDLEAAHSAGIKFVRRPTGGRTVLHDRECTYSIALPVTGSMSSRTIYGVINEGLIIALGALGVHAEISSTKGAALRPDAGPCFRKASEGDVTVDGKKLVGSAQVRIGDVIMQHGSILLTSSQDRLTNLRCGLQGTPNPTCLEEILGRIPPWHIIVERVTEGLSDVLGGEWHRGMLTKEEENKMQHFKTHYASEEWTWGI